MSSRSDSRPASQFVNLTSKLMGRLHTQWIKRPEHIKHISSESIKPSEDDLQQNQSVGMLAGQQQAVISSLQYFKALVDKLGVEKSGGDKRCLDHSVVGGLLGGASSRVLEAVQVLAQLDPHLHDNKSISGCLTRLNHSLAKLIQWVDQVMLQSFYCNNKDSTESVTTVIRAVLDSVKELVKLVTVRLEGSAPISPVQSESKWLDDKDKSDLKLTCKNPAEHDGISKMKIRKEEEHLALAPPKPPMPVLHAVAPELQSPPALPPKKRQTSTVPCPSPCRVAVVAPMRRETDAALEQDDSCLKRLSSSANSDDDPDYEFLHTDLSLSEQLPNLPLATLCPALPEKRHQSSTGPEELESSPLSSTKTPPPLPEKKHHIHQYLQLCLPYNDDSAAMFYQRHNSRQPDMDTTQQLCNDSTPQVQPLPAPALPPKKKQQGDSSDTESDDIRSRHIKESVMQEIELRPQSSEGEQVEEMLLTDQEKICCRITMKTEDEDGPEVKAASPEILLVYASELSSSEDELFCEAFLCTYRSFISPDKVIRKLQHRYNHLWQEEEPGNGEAAKNTFHLLVRVVDELSPVELEPDLLLLLVDLVFSLLTDGKLDLAHLLHSKFLSIIDKRWKLTGSPRSFCPLASKGVAARPGTLLDYRSQDLAEQLTLLDSQLFFRIELPEVLLWSKEQNEEKSPNLTKFTQHFNNVSFWVRSVIILQEKAQDREKLLLKFLKIMKHLRKLNNFNSYLAILSALDSAPLRRLDWQKNTTESLEELSSLIDSSSSFRVYRAALAEVEPPCIPYLGLILQDLTFVHLGNPDNVMTSQGSKVNFCKRWQQFNILDTLRSYQQVAYSLQPDNDIISFFNDFNDHLAEEALWELSLRIRPRNAPRTNQR
uniref:CRK SH3-binding GNRP n=1 Tax=Oryzias sinensis TaxID=183150 RepID=A0A8C7ZC42_9TELE